MTASHEGKDAWRAREAAASKGANDSGLWDRSRAHCTVTCQVAREVDSLYATVCSLWILISTSPWKDDLTTRPNAAGSSFGFCLSSGDHERKTFLCQERRSIRSHCTCYMPGKILGTLCVFPFVLISL